MNRIRSVNHVIMAAVVLLVASVANASRQAEAPSTLTIVGATQSSITVSWDVSPGLRYQASLNSTVVATDLRGPTYAFSGLVCGTSYLLGIDSTSNGHATTAVGNTMSSTAPCPAPPPDTAPPTAPTGLQVLSASTSSVSVGWDHSVDNVAVAGYGIFLSGANVTSTTSTSFTFSNLSCGTSLAVGVNAFDAAGNASATANMTTSTVACAAPDPQMVQHPKKPTTTQATTTQPTTTQATTTQPTTTQATTTQPTTTTSSSPAPGSSLFVSPSGSDSNPCSQAAPCASLNGAYQVGKAGQTVSVAAGSYPAQTIQSRADLRNLSCTPAAPGSCVHFVGSGVTINGSLEIHGSDVWVDGGQTRGGPYGITVTGYSDTEADSASSYPDHVVVSGVHTTSFGVFNADTVTFEAIDVGPATVSSGCEILQGPGIENKIGGAGSISVVPTNITLDGLVIHDQNADSGRIAGNCHFGGLFLQTANGLTIENTVFQGNVVYNVQIQNFGGMPPATNVTFDHDSFGCPVDWLYNGAGCDNQSSIQFDGTFPGVTVKNTAFAEGGNAGWGCYAGTCDYSGDTFGPSNTFAAPSTQAPPLPA